MKPLRIGYAPYRRDLSAPGDRRRFVHYARRRGLSLEVYSDGAPYDLLVVSEAADISALARLPKGGPRIIFDFIDSYLDIDPREPKALLRGPAKFLLGQHRHFDLSYHDLLRRMCARADVVVCSTPEQKAKIASINPAVFPILDFHEGELRRTKTEFAAGSPFNLLWEGMGANVVAFEEIAGVLRGLSLCHPIALHLVTDLSYARFNGPVPRLPTRRVVDCLLPGVRSYLYEWNQPLFADICCACDLAVIPILRRVPIFDAKPENRLLLMWRMNIPTVTSASPAYARAMRAAGLAMACDGEESWHAMLSRCIESESLRREAARAGKAFVELEHSEEQGLARWDEALSAAGLFVQGAAG